MWEEKISVLNSRYYENTLKSLRWNKKGSWAGNESIYNAGDPGSIPGLGRSAGERIGYPLQYSWASLVVQLVKNPPAMWETWVPSLSWEGPLEKGKATHSSILAWRISRTVNPKSRTWLSDFHSPTLLLFKLLNLFNQMGEKGISLWF